MYIPLDPRVDLFLIGTPGFPGAVREAYSYSIRRVMTLPRDQEGTVRSSFSMSGYGVGIYCSNSVSSSCLVLIGRYTYNAPKQPAARRAPCTRRLQLRHEGRAGRERCDGKLLLCKTGSATSPAPPAPFADCQARGRLLTAANKRCWLRSCSGRHRCSCSECPTLNAGGCGG